MADTFDLEELVHLEQTCYDAGYTDGFAHGRIHGLIEGRALGRDKGFEIWEEIGFYEGFAETWKVLRHEDARALHHITHLLALIHQFPTINPTSASSESDAHTDTDLPKLQRQIRSRYKALCASLGVRPTLRVAGANDQQTNTLDDRQEHRSDVWTLTQTRDQAEVVSGRPPMAQGLSF